MIDDVGWSISTGYFCARRSAQIGAWMIKRAGKEDLAKAAV